MIHELRTYTIALGRLEEFVEVTGSVGRPIRGDRYGKLLGYWTTPQGRVDQVVHLWEYPDLATRTAVRTQMMQDPRWLTEYIPRSLPLIVEQANVLLVPAEWHVMPTATGLAVYELRTSRLHPGKVSEWMTHCRAAMGVRGRYGMPVGIWSIEVGPLNTVVELWGYREPNDWLEGGRALARDPEWREMAPRLNAVTQRTDSTLLVPSSFSPLR